MSAESLGARAGALGVSVDNIRRPPKQFHADLLGVVLKSSRKELYARCEADVRRCRVTLLNAQVGEMRDPFWIDLHSELH